MIKPIPKYSSLYSSRGRGKRGALEAPPARPGSTVGVQVLAAVRRRRSQREQEQDETKQGISLPGQVTARAGLPVGDVSRRPEHRTSVEEPSDEREEETARSPRSAPQEPPAAARKPPRGAARCSRVR